MSLKFGKYEVIKELGKGAMGVVYKAYDPVLDREVAIKAISSTESDHDLTERFIREARSAGRLRHNNIITIYDFGEERGQLFIAMELLEGTDLDSIISSKPNLELNDRIEIIRQICLGLDYAHRHNIYHRDIKPANIKVLPDKTVKIMDFGLATMQTSALTRTGTIMGTPHYMSPEMIKGEHVDGRSDQFAVGVLMYELLTHQRPFTGETISTILYNIMNSEPHALDTSLTSKYPQITSIVARAIQKDPRKRYPDMKTMAEDIEKVQKLIVKDGYHQTQATVVIQDVMETVLQDTELDMSLKKREKSKLPLIIGIGVTAAAIVLLVLFVLQPGAITQDKFGYFQLNVRPWAKIESITNIETGEAIPNNGDYTPLRLVLPPGKYNLTYSNPGWAQNRSREFTIRNGEITTVSDSVEDFIERAIQHFTINK